ETPLHMIAATIHQRDEEKDQEGKDQQQQQDQEQNQYKVEEARL
ncbi:putative outer protein E, partial [Chlamydia psittaci 84-8471/1]